METGFFLATNAKARLQRSCSRVRKVRRLSREPPVANQHPRANMSGRLSLAWGTYWPLPGFHPFWFLFGLAMKQARESSLSVVAVSDNVVWLQRRSDSVGGDSGLSPSAVKSLPALMERACYAARQMRYFSVATKRFSFDELIHSAKRAGFVSVETDLERKEATFQSPAGAPELFFSVSFGDPAKVATVAEAGADIFGLVLTSYSHAPTISVETNPSLKNEELGPNALMLREALLTFPDFDNVPAWTKYW